MSTLEEGSFYVYRHIREDKNEPFYIGISADEDYKRSRSKRRNIVWHRIVKKTSWYPEILFDNISEKFAYEKETEFIRLYGRLDLGTGTLANLTDGGEGIKNHRHGEVVRKRISENNARYWSGKKRDRKGVESQREKMVGRTGDLCKNSKSVIAIYPDGLERRFGSMTEAAKILTKENEIKVFRAQVGKICQGLIYSTAGGFRFKLEHDRSFDERWNKITPNWGKPVLVTTISTGESREFRSLSEACRYYSESLLTKIDTGSASRVATGERNKHKGLIFKYI